MLKIKIQQIRPPFFQSPIRANTFSPNFAIKYRENGTVDCFLTSPFEGYSKPFLKISSIHLILAYHAGTTLRIIKKRQQNANL